ncbi:amidohydrolase family protein [Gammaproteobacteria bacterium]|nr:amidohydrolase family protein [Gammaproteobacteria bacterium]
MIKSLLAITAFSFVVMSAVFAEESTAQLPSQTLFKNVHVWDGTSDGITKKTNVLIENNIIKKVRALDSDAHAEANIVDGAGRILMPGLIDSHVHFNMMLIPDGIPGLETSTWEQYGALAMVSAREYIMSGFTTVRDLGGMGVGYKKVIDSGVAAGPRIYAAGTFISQTSGHGDFRLGSQPAGTSNAEKLRITALADGVPEVLKVTRENFANGSAFVKLMVGGGVSSEKDPLHSEQFTDAEISAVVETAEKWDSYSAAHVYHADHIKRALRLGIESIDHGHFIDKEGMKLLVKKDAFLSTNLAAFSQEVLDHPVYGNPNGPQYPKMMQFLSRGEGFKQLANKYKPKMVFNTDIVLSTLPVTRAVRDNAMYMHADMMGNLAALKAMTSVGGELAQATGQNNPYPKKLGVIEEGAYADIILVDGNPLEDITVLGAHEVIFTREEMRGETVDTIDFIMKDGKVYHNDL